ncbi:methyl-accepting chemotaxis protein [Sporosarcina sp. NCCP-2716]|uniref:methyl-accepting chemotaxis protein n=1 Tax=Sporosarcina sp. NCCP-2716 TaxID=2943679 RepID=UPI00203FF355|nr:methyl-accepting chemotaxis protein [Sporosarcina sp. NCCP-2716]GKV69024.1 methyl-accepting chemotaxis protein [Sporosarcina sp. NCCP-2716]
MKKTKSLVFRLSAIIIGVFLILFAVYALGTNIYTHSLSVSSAEEKAADETELVALKLSEQFRQTGESLMTTKRVLETMNENSTLAASEVLSVLQANLEGNPNAVSMNAVFESGVLSTDGLTITEKRLVDPDGRFIPFLLKSESGLKIMPATGYEEPGNGDWYLTTKESKKPFLQEPVVYETPDKTTKVTSLSVPILSADGKLLGVLSANMSLDFLKGLTADIAPHGGYASVISDDGVLIENSLKEKMNGTNMKDAIDWEPVKEKTTAGEPVTMYVESQSYNERAFNTFAPLTIDGFDQSWTVQTVLPRSEIIAEFSKIVIFTLIAAGVMILLVGLTTAFFIYRHIRPLTRVQHSMEQAATGDLSETVAADGFREDEIGSVAKSYNYMLAQTNEALGEVLKASGQLTDSSAQVNHAFEEIVASSQEVSVATEEIAEGAARQSEDTEETSRRIGGLAEQITAISAISAQMEQLSHQTVESTQNGMTEVGRLRNQNENANRMNGQVEQQMTALTDKISGINQVITSIQDITAQTNLLALNASIEAARAGEHGKGFAVVAEEVRKLAEQSSRETGTIQQTVQEILDQSKATVEVIAQNTKSMKDQSASVASTGESFALNAELTERMNRAIDELSGNLKDMVSHKDQAVLAIQSVSAVSEETAASAEQVSASSVAQQGELERVAESVQQMTRIAGELQLVVDRFKLAAREQDA